MWNAECRTQDLMKTHNGNSDVCVTGNIVQHYYGKGIQTMTSIISTTINGTKNSACTSLDLQPNTTCTMSTNIK